MSGLYSPFSNSADCRYEGIVIKIPCEGVWSLQSAFQKEKEKMVYKTLVPPLGVKPKFIYEEQRFYELKAAIQRFIESNWPIPDEIMSEYNEMANKLTTEPV